MTGTAGNGYARPLRPVISLDAGTIKHDGCKCRLVMRRNLISVGCTDVTYEAAKEIVRLYESKFGVDGEIVIQP